MEPTDNLSGMNTTEDRLKTVNRGIKENEKEEDSGTAWLPLESNPDLFNEFAIKIGLKKNVYEFIDVPAPELIEDHSKVEALILLFPCTERIYEFRGNEEKMIKQNDLKKYLEISKHLFFLEQISEFGNACGTIALLHVLSNLNVMNSDSCVTSFKEKTNHLNPHERGKELVKEPSLKVSSDTAAESDAAQTECPSRDGPDLDHHFVSFVYDKDNTIWELDGTKCGPIMHGKTNQDQFLNDAMNVIRNNFMSLEPDLIEFVLCALVSKL